MPASSVYRPIESYLSGKLTVVMEMDGDVWIEAQYEDGSNTPLMRIDCEGVSGLEAFEILHELIADHYAKLSEAVKACKEGRDGR